MLQKFTSVSKQRPLLAKIVFIMLPWNLRKRQNSQFFNWIWPLCYSQLFKSAQQYQNFHLRKQNETDCYEPKFSVKESIKIKAILCLNPTQGQKFYGQQFGETRFHFESVVKLKYAEFWGTDIDLYSCTWSWYQPSRRQKVHFAQLVFWKLR